MPLKKCPKCAKAVADQLELCPYCGYRFFNAQNHYGSMSAKKGGCTVMITHAKGTILHNKRVLSEVIDSTLREAECILHNLPYTLYQDITINNAKRLCKQLRNIGISSELIDEDGNKTAFKPTFFQTLFTDKNVRKKNLQPANEPLPFVKPMGASREKDN